MSLLDKDIDFILDLVCAAENRCREFKQVFDLIVELNDPPEWLTKKEYQEKVIFMANTFKMMPDVQVIPSLDPKYVVVSRKHSSGDGKD